MKRVVKAIKVVQGYLHFRCSGWEGPSNGRADGLRRRVTLRFADCLGQSRMTVMRRELSRSRGASPDLAVLSLSLGEGSPFGASLVRCSRLPSTGVVPPSFSS